MRKRVNVQINYYDSGDFLKKIKIYLDTSVISHLFADDAPDKMTETNKNG